MPENLHQAEGARDALVLTHGAGSNCATPLLVAVAEAFAASGITVLRYELPFRQARPHGPPLAGDAARDRDGLKQAAIEMRKLVPGRVFLGGHSYGGRQATLLATTEPGLVDGLLLLAYPLHPPRRPEQLRTAHFPTLKTPAVFVHGARDPFGTLDQMRQALALIPGPTTLIEVEGAGHDLSRGDAAQQAVAAFRGLMP
jgi:predicted alpha/beta-hydrolase family hydrolase